MHEKRFNRNIERLRDPERIIRLEVERVVQMSLENLENVTSVLDIGTGSGLFAEQFAGHGLRVTGLDANPDMLPVALQYVPEATFHKGIAEDLPFPNDSFDLVFMGLVLHETDDTSAAICEAFRVSTKRLVVLEWSYENQDFGPPLTDRVSPEKINEYAALAGCRSVSHIRLNQLSLYLFER